MTIFNITFPFNVSELLNALAIVVGFIVAGMIFSWLIKRYFVKWASRTKTTVDDILVEKAKPPFSYIIWFLGLKIALRPLHLDYQTVDRVVDSIIILIVIYLIGVILDVVVRAILEKMAMRTKSDMDDAVVPLVDKGLKIVVVIIGLVWVLSVWDVNIGPILGGLGIAGLALGFAVKDSLANVFGGVSLILDRSIKVGDRIKLESGEVGNVIDVGIRSTKMRTFDNEIITIPNGQLAISRIQNFAKPDLSHRLVIDFGVDYKSDVDLVRKTVLEVIKNMENIKDDPLPEVLFLSMEDYYLKFSARFWVANYEDGWEKKLEATDKMFRALKEAKINIPFPVQTVHVKK